MAENHLSLTAGAETFPRGGLRWALATSFLVCSAGFALAAHHRGSHNGVAWLAPDMTGHLGSEYANIARAIRRGSGFSDPFGSSTGATGWMPPAVPYALAGIYWMTDDDSGSVVTVVVAVQFSSLWFCLSLVLYEFGKDRLRTVHAVAAAVAVFAHFFYLFQLSHDHVVLMALGTLVWYQFSRYWNPPKSDAMIALFGLLGGTAALASPTLGFAWAVMTVVRYRVCPRAVILSAAASLTVVSPWIIYNSWRLEAFVPIKSNLAYELWQAQLVDDDGVVDSSVFYAHPYGGLEAASYEQLGEIEFLQRKRREWLAHVSADPLSAAERIANRLTAAFLWYQPFHRSELSRPWFLYLKRAWTALATIALLVAFTRRATLSRSVVAAAMITLLYLCPYVLVSYYERYDIAVFPLRLLVLLTALGQLLPEQRGVGEA